MADSARTCQQCTHYNEPEPGATRGTCGYPLPRFVQLACPYWVVGYEAEDCATFDPRDTVAPPPGDE